MISKRTSILYTAMGFLLSLGALGGLIYVIVMLDNHARGESPFVTMALIGGMMLLVIVCLPVFFLKKFSRLSRHVSKDDSRFTVSRIPDHQERTQIHYH